MSNKKVQIEEKVAAGIIGASSFVGTELLKELTRSGWQVVAYSRQSGRYDSDGVEWRNLASSVSSPVLEGKIQKIPVWVCLAPIWVLPEYFNLLEVSGVKRIIAFSSTSIFSKANSIDSAEQALVSRLIKNESCLRDWAERKAVEWIIVRTTMIYGMGQDKNVAEIVRLVQRWGFFPLLGQGMGLRQPVHVKDVAVACQSMMSLRIKNHYYTLSGGEVIAYKKMIERIFKAIDKRPFFIRFPRFWFRVLLYGVRLLPRFRKWSLSMVDRMDQNFVFDHKDATIDIGYNPRGFFLVKEDLP